MTVEPMLTIAPRPRAFIALPNSWTINMVPLMSTARQWSMISSVRSSQPFWSDAMSPTLLTSTSTSPASDTMRLMSSHDEMSPCTSRVCAPSASTRCAVSSAPALDER